MAIPCKRANQHRQATGERPFRAVPTSCEAPTAGIRERQEHQYATPVAARPSGPPHQHGPPTSITRPASLPARDRETPLWGGTWLVAHASCCQAGWRSRFNQSWHHRPRTARRTAARPDALARRWLHRTEDRPRPPDPRRLRRGGRREPWPRTSTCVRTSPCVSPRHTCAGRGPIAASSRR